MGLLKTQDGALTWTQTSDWVAAQERNVAESFYLGQGLGESREKDIVSPTRERRMSRANFTQPEHVSTENLDTHNYKDQLPAVEESSPLEHVQYMSLGGDTRYLYNEGLVGYSEDVADRNINKFGSQASASHKSSVVEGSTNMNLSSIPSRPSSHTLRRTTSKRSTASVSSIGNLSLRSVPITTPPIDEDKLEDGIFPAIEAPGWERRHRVRGEWPARMARDESRLYKPRKKSVSIDVEVSRGPRSNQRLMDIRSAVMDEDPMMPDSTV